MRGSRPKTQNDAERGRERAGFTPPLIARHYPLWQEGQRMLGSSRDKTAGHSRAGFTLLETVVALTVILAAVVGPVSLITKGLFNFSLSKNRVIAANLAQEGIELIRLIRENNIACDEANGPPVWQWRRDPRGGMMTQLRVGVDAGDFDAPLECGDETIAFPHLSSSCSPHLRFEPNAALPNRGMYGYGGSKETIFSRCVDVASPPDSPTSGIPAADQMDVISTVNWDEHGNPRSVTLRERLTNWR